MVGRIKKAYLPISAKIQNPIKFYVLRISTRSKRYSIPYPFLCIKTQFDETDINGMMSKITLKTTELQYQWLAYIQCNSDRRSFFQFGAAIAVAVARTLPTIIPQLAIVYQGLYSYLLLCINWPKCTMVLDDSPASNIFKMVGNQVCTHISRLIYI